MDMSTLKPRGVRLPLEPDFLKLWLGQTISLIGDNLGAMAITVMMVQKTGSALVVAIGLAIQFIPPLVFGPIAGVLIDRFSRRKIMVVSDCLRGVITLIIALLIRQGFTQVGYAYSWQFVLAIFRMLYAPATQAIIPALVSPDRLQRANSLQGMGINVAQILGPALAGIAVTAMGASAALALDALSFFVSAGLIDLVRTEGEVKASPRQRSALGQFGEGLAFFKQNRIALLLLCSAIMMNFTSTPTGVTMQVHVLKTLGSDSKTLGFIWSVGAFAALLASLILVGRKRWGSLGILLVSAMVAGSISLILTSLPTKASYLPATFSLFRFAGPFGAMAVQTMYQEITPTDMRGRVFAVRSSLSSILSPIAVMGAGWAVDATGSGVVLRALGLIELAAALGIGLSSVARRSPYFQVRSRVTDAA